MRKFEIALLRRGVGCVQRFGRNRRGGTALEYALIAVILSIGIIGVLSSTGDTLEDRWSDMNAEVGKATPK